MFRHLLKLIWKRKSRNMMLSLEILLAFVIVFAIAATGLRNYQLYQLPTGFVATDVWSVEISGIGDGQAGLTPQAYDQLKRGLLAMPGALQVAFASAAPYASHNFRTGFTMEGGRYVKTEIAFVTDDFFKLLDIKVIQGRAFDLSDEGATAAPVVINRRLALEMFGTTDVIGKQFDSAEHGPNGRTMKRVVGLIDDFR
ncbi:MAG: ABC transporter permease, partial [Telluria sp.]